MTGFNRGYCNAYGAENPDGQAVNLGGFDKQRVAIQSICQNRAVHRCRWVCEHGHPGSVVELCTQHVAEFTGDQSAAWNVRRDVQFCPRCNAGEDLPRGVNPDHRCAVRLVFIS